MLRDSCRKASGSLSWSSSLEGKNDAEIKRYMWTRQCGGVEMDCSGRRGFVRIWGAIIGLQANEYHRSFPQKSDKSYCAKQPFQAVKDR